ncbi:hypothetical protein KSP40_PGU016671 [Platanthera guangdongensis]|uniref:Uncharacterized protein n=1 Tax=Platanthera guangdongensis TaxID=2320717 RepID=A0ABR2MXX8_9ASPA
MAWEDFSMSATVVPFDPPVPLLRGPVAAGMADEPSSRSFVLAFRDAASWRAAFRATESKIVEQCEVSLGLSMQAGARAGCSITVSNMCKLPWWRIILGAKSMDFAEREQCEEREMFSCMAPAKAACSKFAREKCIPAFQEARIMARGSTTYKGSKLMSTDNSNYDV